jgi:hypothetical protein
MAKGEIPPFRTEQPAHDPAAKDDMLLPLKTVHVGARHVASIMQEEGKPKPRIPGKPEQPPPCPGDEKWMNPNRMDSKEHALSSYSHTELTPAVVVTPF